MLQFVVEEVLSADFDAVLNIFAELDALSLAAKGFPFGSVLVPLGDIYPEYENLNANVQLLEGMHHLHATALQFFNEATLEIENLKKRLDAASTGATAALKYCGEDSESSSFEELLQLLLGFLTALKVFILHSLLTKKSATTSALKKRLYHEGLSTTNGGELSSGLTKVCYFRFFTLLASVQNANSLRCSGRF